MSSKKEENNQQTLIAELLKAGAHTLPNMGNIIHDLKVVVRTLPIFEHSTHEIFSFLDSLVTISTIEGNAVVLLFVREVHTGKKEKDAKMLLQLGTENGSIAYVEITVKDEEDGTTTGFEIRGDNKEVCIMIATAVETIKSPETAQVFRKDNFAEKDANDVQEESSEEILND